MYKGLVCTSSLGVFVRHLWVQERALPWPCNQGMSAPRFRNASFGSLFQCFSLWAALLRLKRTEQHRSSTWSVFFSTLLPPQRYKDTMLPFPFNTYCILCKSFLAAVHSKVHPLVQSSSLEVTACGPKQSRLFAQSEWCSASRQKSAQVVSGREWEHSCAFRSSSALRSSQGTWWAGAAVHGLYSRSSGNQMMRSKQRQQNSTAQP